MPRGRGTLEIKPSTNPFYETTNRVYGDQDLSSSSDNIKRILSASKPIPAKQSEFSFLYTRTSDVYGSDPAKAQINNSFNYDDVSAFKGTMTRQDSVSVKEKHTVDVEAALKLYKHDAVYQNPLYATSASDIGKKAPTVATYVAERAHRSQAFSKSFNHMKPKSSSLNTGLTKSTIHPSLNPQFT